MPAKLFKIFNLPTVSGVDVISFLTFGAKIGQDVSTRHFFKGKAYICG
jgi:hypothetical protein